MHAQPYINSDFVVSAKRHDTRFSNSHPWVHDNLDLWDASKGLSQQEPCRPFRSLADLRDSPGDETVKYHPLLHFAASHVVSLRRRPVAFEMLTLTVITDCGSPLKMLQIWSIASLRDLRDPRELSAAAVAKRTLSHAFCRYAVGWPPVEALPISLARFQPLLGHHVSR